MPATAWSISVAKGWRMFTAIALSDSVSNSFATLAFGDNCSLKLSANTIFAPGYMFLLVKAFLTQQRRC